MASTAVLTEDSATIVAENIAGFRWGIVIAGAVAAMAVIFFLLALGTGVGLSFVAAPDLQRPATSFLTMGAIYFFASQAFGFAVGGYLVGRLIGPEAENTEEEEFRAAAHGFVMWALAVVAGLLIAGASATLAGSAMAGGGKGQAAAVTGTAYRLDLMFRPAADTPALTADKMEAGHILALAPAISSDDTERLARLVVRDTGMPMAGALDRIARIEAMQRQATDNIRKAASIFSLWTAFALLFGAIVATAAAISARWMDDKITFSLAARR